MMARYMLDYEYLYLSMARMTKKDGAKCLPYLR